jgi:hypothetical protein
VSGQVTIDLAHLIDSNWVRFSPDEQQVIQQRIHDLVMLTLSNALDDAVTPSVVVTAGPITPSAAQAVAWAPERPVAADVPFGDESNYADRTYDDFAKLCEDNGVPPTSGIGHWFGKSEGVEFDHSTPALRRKVFAEMQAFYATVKDSHVPQAQIVAQGPPPQAVPQQPYVDVDLQNCPSCGQPAKFVQGGVSRKTGKPYSGFYACNKRPPCSTFYNGQAKDLTWTVDADWQKSYQRTHSAGVGV